MSVSVVIPICNEQDNLLGLYDSLKTALSGLARAYEIIFVNDGSRDGSERVLNRLAESDAAVKVIHFRRNFGQTAALSAGIEHATGEAIVTMDGDRQNDPADIPAMLEMLEQGYDLVHGWRKNRQDAWLHRKLPSQIANWLIARVTGFPVNDLGCTLKVMRSEVAKELRLYGEMHRFIPILAHWQGARCVEIVTRHHPRTAGETKYGLWRTFRVLMDLVTVKYMTRYFVSPMKLFGGVGAWCLLGGLLSGIATIAMKLGPGIDMTGNPLLLLSAVAGILGVQFFMLGLLGEVGARTYFESQGRKPYLIRSLRNFELDSMRAESPAAIPAPHLRRSQYGNQVVSLSGRTSGR